MYPQQEWLTGAWNAVAEVATRWGVDRDAFRDALAAVAAEGSDRGRIIDRALDRLGAVVPVGSLVSTFLSHRPTALHPYPGVRDALAAIGKRARLGVVTDGDPQVQRAKVDALGLTAAFDVIVVSDELGRVHRKPDPAPFRLALDRLGIPAARAVFVGDRPDKDMLGACAAGIRSVRVRTGEFAGMASHPTPWIDAPTLASAVRVMMKVMESGSWPGRTVVAR